MQTLPNIKILPNGLRVMNVPFEGIQSATITMRGRAGSNYEKPNELGVAHLLEHAVFDGTEKYPTNIALDATVENVGGSSNARTSREQVEYFAKFLKEDIEIGFDVLSQLAIKPLLQSKTVLREREIVRQEAIRKESDPVDRFFRDRFKTFFPKQRVSIPIIGELGDIKKINQKTVSSFFQSNYVAENFVLGVCGDLDDAYVFDLAEKYFGHMASGELNKLASWSKSERNECFVRTHQEVKQATVKISYFAPVFDHPDMYPTYFLASVLGDSFLSRLVHRLRTQLGYAYSVSCSYDAGLDYSMFGIYMQLGEKNFDKAIEEIKKEISKITTELITDDEFHRELKQILTGYVFYFEAPGNRLGYYTNKMVQGLYPGLDHNQVLEKYRAVTKEDVLRVAQKIFSSPSKIGVISNSITKKQVENAW